MKLGSAVGRWPGHRICILRPRVKDIALCPVHRVFGDERAATLTWTATALFRYCGDSGNWSPRRAGGWPWSQYPFQSRIGCLRALDWGPGWEAPSFQPTANGVPLAAAVTDNSSLREIRFGCPTSRRDVGSGLENPGTSRDVPMNAVNPSHLKEISIPFTSSRLHSPPPCRLSRPLAHNGHNRQKRNSRRRPND